MIRFWDYNGTTIKDMHSLPVGGGRPVCVGAKESEPLLKVEMFILWKPFERSENAAHLTYNKSHPPTQWSIKPPFITGDHPPPSAAQRYIWTHEICYNDWSIISSMNNAMNQLQHPLSLIIFVQTL